MNDVDLSALRMDPAATAVPRRPLGPRLLVGASLLLVLIVVATFVWPLVRPVRVVATAPVRVAAAGAGAATMAIAEAAGWIEPDPFPVLVRPLVAGRVESIATLEGAPVVAGETVVATLASAALQAQYERATAMVAERARMLGVATEQLALAEGKLAQKAEPRAAFAEAEMQLQDRHVRLAAARGAQERAQAELRSADAALQAQQRLSTAGSGYELALRRAEASRAAADAIAGSSAREVAAMELELTAAATRVAVAKAVVDDPVDLAGQVAVARAEVERARVAHDSAMVDCSIAERESRWLTVRAPVSGVVMRVTATPGASVGPDSEPILALYDPAKLRARIDVPLGAVGGIREGQQVELRSEVLGNVTVRGVVQRVQRESDLLKNTLQVKVQVVDPPPLLRPETLCRARFLADATTPAESRPVAFRVPKAAVRGSLVFVLDPALLAARGVAVEVVQPDGDDVVVRGELSVAQRVILVPVSDGERVREAAR